MVCRLRIGPHHSLLVLVLMGCVGPQVRITSRLTDAQRERERDVTCTGQFLEARASLTTVALRAPDSCINKAASEQTGAGHKEEDVLRTTCGVEMAELERALSRQGYVVSSWRDLANMVVNERVSARDAALRLNAQILFQVNSLEKLKLTPRDVRWEREFYRADERGQSKGPAFQPTGNELLGLREVFAPEEQALLDRAPPGAMLDVDAVMISTGQTVWFYRWAKAQKREASFDVVSEVAQLNDGAWVTSVPATRPPTTPANDDGYFLVLRDVVSDFANEFRAAGHCAGAIRAVDHAEEHSAATATRADTLIQRASEQRAKGLRSDAEKTLRECVTSDGKSVLCHYALFEIFREDRRERDAEAACKNVIKFATGDQFGSQRTTCKKFLSSTE